MQIRPIRPDDNAAVAHIIRTVMTEFGAVGQGYSIEDPEVDAMYEAHIAPLSLFLVVVDDHDQPLGCAGIAPLKGGDADTCELKKMYFLPAMRGTGMGRKIIVLLENAARELGYRQVYLETISAMAAANHLYQNLEYQALPGNLGNTGHSACGLFYVKKL